MIRLNVVKSNTVINKIIETSYANKNLKFKIGVFAEVSSVSKELHGVARKKTYLNF
jgi:hypothetical protein